MKSHVVAVAAVTLAAAGLVPWLAAPEAALFFWPAAAAVAVAPLAWRGRGAPWLVAVLAAIGFAFCELATAAQPSGLTFGQGADAKHLPVTLRSWASWDTAVMGAALLLAVARVAGRRPDVS